MGRREPTACFDGLESDGTKLPVVIGIKPAEELNLMEHDFKSYRHLHYLIKALRIESESISLGLRCA